MPAKPLSANSLGYSGDCQAVSLLLWMNMQGAELHTRKSNMLAIHFLETRMVLTDIL